MRNKARYWQAVLYPENMRPDWREMIGDLVQLPYVFCVHDKDRDSKSEHRKDHVHMILAFSNTTTYKNAMSVFDLLSAENKKAVNTCQAVINIRAAYDYLIHDTETCRKKGKFLYPTNERISGNNFDIGAFEQLTTQEIQDIYREFLQIIAEKKPKNFMDFFDMVRDLIFSDSHYLEVYRMNSASFERHIRGNYLRWQAEIESVTVFRDRWRSTQVCHDTEQANESKENASCVVDHETECVGGSPDRVATNAERGYSDNLEIKTTQLKDTDSECYIHGVDMKTRNLDNKLVIDNVDSDTNGFVVKSCPFCMSSNIVKRGLTAAGTQRFKCNHCGRTFSIS